jgi:hypothetical protein
MKSLEVAKEFANGFNCARAVFVLFAEQFDRKWTITDLCFLNPFRIN